MRDFDNLIVSIIYLLFPILCYLLYIIFKRKSYGKEQDIMLELFLYTSIYLVLKICPPVFNKAPLILCNIPLLIALMKDKKICSFLASAIIVMFTYHQTDVSPILLTAEYLFYLSLYFAMKDSKKKVYIFILIVSITKLVIYPNLENIFFVLTYYLVANGIAYIYSRVDNILKYHDAVDEMEKEKNLRNSLFTITHEIKNPLAVCKGYLQMCQTNPKGRDQYIKIMQSEIERTLVILDDFMNLSKIKIHKEEMDINLLLEDLIESTKMLCENNHIEVKDYLLDDDIYIEADYNRLKQVLINIIKNSVEASKEYGVIKISSDIINNHAVITICDNGVGMDEKTVAKLGDVYFTTKNHGNGIGVSFSKEIIESHDGTIKYESKLNHGTKVVIKLPMIQFS